MASAAAHGLHVSKPWGESDRYDVAIEHKGRFLRVQVKSVSYKVGPSYRCGIRTCSREDPYKCRDADFFAIYIVPEDLWYILPANVATNHANQTIILNPQLESNRYQPYKESWQLLQAKKKRVPKQKLDIRKLLAGTTIFGCAETDVIL